jgi:serine/threonine protein kinase/tetratricopeptide (TPR) repeat protein
MFILNSQELLVYDGDVQQLSDYLLIEKLGGGGSGVVYKAQDRRQGRIVALKVTRAAQHQKANTQFERELAASQSLQHPHIAGIENIETLDDGRLLIVMPFLEGKTVDKLLVPISFQEALNIIIQTTKGLAHAHSQGIIHCDIKPANLMVIKGWVKILDFGLARLESEVHDGEQIGTLEYMSPEAARGQRLTPSSDLWSLGVVFYELLTGHSPFRATSTVGTLRRIAEHTPSFVTDVRAGLPKSVDVVVQRLLSKREDRYSSVEELLSDLEALRDGKILSQSETTQTELPRQEIKATFTKLPEKPNLLLGRDDELALISLYLNDDDCRLLTLQGMGGIGKTHLALWATHEQASFKQNVVDAIHFVELVSVTESGFIAALANTLNIDGDATLDAVAKFIGNRKQLLVLDNFEHLTSRAFVLETLLESCPNLKLFITTRERLARDVEWVLPLQGLSIPIALPSTNEARQYAALAFFEIRAKRQNEMFDLNSNLPSVYSICSFLRGHPLGISLAAAMLEKISITELAEMLDKNFDMLESGTGRHRSLKTVFDESYKLLSPEQQHLLACIGIFESGFELDAAKAIAGASKSTLDVLLDHSLLELSIEGRYHQHPILHSFCKERLSALEGDINDRYQHYYLEKLKTFRAMLRGTEQSKAFERLKRDFANLRSVIENQTEPLSPDIAEPFRAFYTHNGRYTEGWELFSRSKGEYAQVSAAWFALMLGNLEEAEKLNYTSDNATDIQCQLVFTNTAAGIALQNHHYESARDLTLKAMHLATQSRDLPMSAACTSNLALIEELLGNVDTAIAYYRRSLELSEASHNIAQIIVNLNNLAVVHLTKKQIAEAKLLVERALLLSEKSNLKRMRPHLLTNFGLCLYAERDYKNAEVSYREAFQAFLERGDKAETIAVRAYMGQVSAILGRRNEGIHILYEALELSRTLNHETGMLSVIVRFAEILYRENNSYFKEFAALVNYHLHTEPDDRRLAAKISEGITTNLNLDEAVTQLMMMKESISKG